jgi:hypothetical protein
MPHGKDTKSDNQRGKLGCMILFFILVLSGIFSIYSGKMFNYDETGIDSNNNPISNDSETDIPSSTRGTRSDEEYLELVSEIGHGTEIGEENSIASADVNNDGIKEVIFGNYEGYVHIIQYSEGDYVDVWKSPHLGSDIPALTTCDTDSDGIVEIIVGTGSGALLIFGYQPGNGSYMQEWADLVFAFDVVGLAADDVDNDGFVEIVTGSSSFAEIPLPNVHVFGYNGNSYELEWLHWAEDSYYNHARTVAIGDVDNDGTKEFVVGISEYKYATQTPRGSFYVFGYNNGIYTMEWKRDDNSVDVVDIDIGDVDSDGFQEIVVGSGTTNIYGYDSGVYHIENVIPDYFANVEVGNVNNDETIEIVTGSASSIRIWQLDSQIWESEVYSLEINGMEINDSDGDNTNEIILGLGDFFTGADVVIIGFNDPDFQEEWEGQYISTVFSVFIDDVDYDSDNELLFGMDYGNIYVFGFENGRYSLEDNISLPYDYEILHIFCNDFDNDGKNEIAAIMPFDIFFIRYVNGNFEVIYQLDVTDFGISTADVGDVDSDGKTELIIGDGDGYLYVIGSDGSSFSIEWESQIYNSQVTALGVGNTDSDGIVEIVVGGYNTDIIFTEYFVYILGKEGNDYIEEWSQISDETIYAVDVGDSDNDGINEIAVMMGFSDLFIIGWDQDSYSEEWTTTDFGGIEDSCLDISNIESEGPNMLVIADYELYVLVYETNYVYQWQTDTIDSGIDCIFIGDANSQGSNEIIVNTGVYIFIYGTESWPVASLSPSKTTVTVGEEISFDGSNSTGTGTLEYLFDFGDGTDSGWIFQSSTTHSYSSDGTFTASLTIKDEYGLESTNPTDIIITVFEPNIPPTAFIDKISPESAMEGDEVSLSGHGFDEDGVITGYLWESTLDGYLNGYDSFSTSLLSEGTHTIHFRVKDDREEWSENVQRQLIISPEIKNERPVARIDSIVPNPATEGDIITFTGRGYDEDGTITSYLWESNLDGELNDQSSFSISSLSIGSHTISFEVQDNNETWSKTEKVTVVVKAIPPNEMPTAFIDSISPNPATHGETIYFKGYGEDIDGTIEKYKWESDIDGSLGSKSSFSTSSLSVGFHVISFKVKDNLDEWSDPVKMDLLVMEEDSIEDDSLEVDNMTVLLIILPIIIVSVFVGILTAQKRGNPYTVTKIECPQCEMPYSINTSERPVSVQCPACGYHNYIY